MCDCAAEKERQKNSKGTQSDDEDTANQGGLSEAAGTWLPIVGGSALLMGLMAFLYKSMTNENGGTSGGFGWLLSFAKKNDKDNNDLNECPVHIQPKKRRWA
ncbi:hypothetical protein K1T71_004716 [Dendrolimus kikuchii]|uniref:Uncharacterized protein n=1 Tax=Dendrolimus kikuchii TaxID=765133 RepID=A0ACC1D8H3_9NEOP|nr:hypothetical protein K1T71_004716 [Dendrolimus kikuchii]